MLKVLVQRIRHRLRGSNAAYRLRLNDKFSTGVHASIPDNCALQAAARYGNPSPQLPYDVYNARNSPAGGV